SRRFAEERLAIATEANDLFGLRHGHSWLAFVAASAGEWREAEDLLAAAEPVLARLESPEPVGFVRIVRAFSALRRGEAPGALEMARDGIRLLKPQGDGAMLWYGGILIHALV